MQVKRNQSAMAVDYFYYLPPLPPQTEQGGNPLPLHERHLLCEYTPVPLHKPQANDEVPEPWQSWQTAATAIPAERRVAANPINRWRREMFFSDFMVMFLVSTPHSEHCRTSPSLMVKNSEYYVAPSIVSRWRSR